MEELSPTVSIEWLKNNIEIKHLVILDASIYADRSHKFIECQESIPNALFFDLRKDFIDTNSSLPNTIPPASQFELNCRKLGINSQSIVVIYDNRGIYTSPRAWWLFKTMGHSAVYVLDGGLPGWKQKTNELSNLTFQSNKNGNFQVHFQPGNLKKFKEMQTIVENQKYCIVDARANGRFNGTEAEPRPELKSGHMQNSKNLPYTKVLKNGYFRSIDELKVLFNELQLKNNNLVFSCGSGITACIILVAAELVLSNSKSVYDGSWTEWATKQKLFTA